jgi:hypothetical protein
LIASQRRRLVTRTLPELVAGMAGLLIAVRDGRAPSFVVWAVIWAVAETFSEQRRAQGPRREREDVLLDLVLPLVLPAAMLVAALRGASTWAVLLGGLCLGGAGGRLYVNYRRA